MISSSIQTVQKMYFHACISIRGCALFSLWTGPHHGRPKTVENKGSNVRYNKINITFPDWVIVVNIIPRNMIINLGTFLEMIFKTITQSGNVIFIYYLYYKFLMPKFAKSNNFF